MKTQNLTLGPISQRIKGRATPKQWHKIVKQAHGKGFTVESFLDQSIPGPLKERTKSSLQNEARDTISKAYQPALGELAQNDIAANAISEKRAHDNQYYLTWLTQRSAELAAHSQAADQQLLGIQNAIGQAAIADTGAMRSQIQQAVAVMPGVVSNPQDSLAAQQMPAAEGNRIQTLVHDQEVLTGQQIQSAAKQQQTVEGNNFGLIAAAEATRQGDLYKTLSANEVARQKTKTQMAADTAQETSRLYSVEGDKAEANRQFGAVADRLGLQQDQFNLSLNKELQRMDEKSTDFKATYGVSPEHYARMTPAERLKWRQKWTKAGLAPPSKKIGKVTYHDGYPEKEWEKMSPAQRIQAHKAWQAAGRGGKGSGGKVDLGMPQKSFEQAYGLVSTSSTPGKPGAAGKPGVAGKRYTRKYVTNHRDLVMQQLMAKGYSHRIAAAAVRAYIERGGSDPGRWRDWVNGLNGTFGPPSP